jgi:putative DNA methylase
MIPKECKRLAEVDFPIAVVSKHSAREKSGPKGHPSTLHLWWARRPLAACRAMLLALLWPDPCDPNCPEEFKDKVRQVLAPVQGRPGPKDEDLRKALLKFIGDFADWDRSADQVYLEASRALVRATHSDEPPLVVDPFAGGGSITLEALRIGCEAFASDLNPVACLILKVMLEDIPRHGPALAEELRRVGAEIKAAAEKELAEFYPVDSDGARPIVYLWARTVKCESPNCGAEMPLMRSFWLCNKPDRKRAYRYRVIRNESEPPRVGLEIFEPKAEREVLSGTVTRAKATCLCCKAVLPPDRVRAQLAEQRGGADAVFDREGKRIGGARLLAVVTLRVGEQGRHYRLPDQKDYETIWEAKKQVERIATQKLPNGLSVIPDEPTPVGGGAGAGRAFSVQKYGMMVFGDLFTARQKVAMAGWLNAFAKSAKDEGKGVCIPGLSLALSRVALCGMSLTNWNAFAEKMQHTYGRQALPMVWDFAEIASLQHTPGAWSNAQDLVRSVASVWPSSLVGNAQLADATDSPLPEKTCDVWFTDPPYYDAVPYADLADLFFVWLKRLPGNGFLLCDPFDIDNPLTPKTREIVQDETKRFDARVKDRSFFETRMAEAFATGRRLLKEDGISSVVFAHKTTEGWEALLSGMIKGGWTITGSWPIATEMGSRLRARESAALATSVHLICRPRPEDAPIGDWADVLRELPKRVGDWMERLQAEHIRGADLVFACIGPALEIFSRYSKVETAEGTEVTLAEYLQKVWEVVGRAALEQILGTGEGKSQKEKVKSDGISGGLEEDARLTALFLWTLQSSNDEVRMSNGSHSELENRNSTLPDEDEEADDDEEEGGSRSKPKGFTLIFDVARRFAQPLGIHLPEWEGRIIETKKGIVRLLPVAERAEQLFGSEGTRTIAERIEQSTAVDVQGLLFPDMEGEASRKAKVKSKKGEGVVRIDHGGQGRTLLTSDFSLLPSRQREATTLDRVHAAMLLQASGKSNALRALIKAELDRGSDFLRLANALSALYPRTSEEKRLLDAMLLAVPR